MSKFENEFNKKLDDICKEVARVIQWANVSIATEIAEGDEEVTLFGSIEITATAVGIKFSYEDGKLKINHSVTTGSKVGAYKDSIQVDDSIRNIVDSEKLIH